MLRRKLRKLARASKAGKAWTKQEVQKRMAEISQIFATYDKILPGEWMRIGKKGEISDKPLEMAQCNYYFTDPICRASKTMAKCVAEIWNKIGS